MNRILFVDVDGPLIPADMFVIEPNASFARSFSPVCLKILEKMCEHAGAKVVMNSTHNTHLNFHNPEPTNLKQDMIDAGFPEEMFHPNWCTTFPRIAQRELAIHNWMHQQGQDFDWMAIDDENFTTDPRLVLVRYDTGIGVVEYNKVMKHFGVKERVFF